MMYFQLIYQSLHKNHNINLMNLINKLLKIQLQVADNLKYPKRLTSMYKYVYLNFNQQVLPHH